MRPFLLRLFLSVFFLLPIIQAHAQKSLLALSKGEHVLAIVDPETLKIKVKVPVGDDPHEIIASSDGKIAYVSNSYGANKHEIDVIDIATATRLPDIQIQPFVSPHGLDFADGKLWFSAEGSSAIGRYNPKTNLVDWTQGTGQNRTHMIYVSADAKKIYATNVNSGTVSILEDSILAPRVETVVPSGNGTPAKTSQHLWTQTVVAVSKGIEGFDILPNGKELWTASALDGKIWVIDLKSKKAISIPGINTFGANRLKFSTDGKMAFVSCIRTGELYFVDTQSHQLIKQIKLGNGCAGMLVDKDQSRLFVACTSDNYIAVIDINKFEVTDKIALMAPDGLAWSNR